MDDIFGVLHAGVEELLAHEVEDLVDRDVAVVADIQVLEETHWFEVLMPRQVLPAHFDL